MALLIDGYNLLHASGIFGDGVGERAFERSRTALLDFLINAITPAEINRSSIVFDASDAPPGLPRLLNHHGLTVHFASKHESADALLEELIEAEKFPRQLTVVSSDHRVQRAARRRKMVYIDADTWFLELQRELRARQLPSETPDAKPNSTLSPDEVRDWLKLFNASPEERAG